MCPPRIRIGTALATVAIVLVTVPALAQERPVRWELTRRGATAPVEPGARLTVRLSAAIDPGWYLYSMAQPAGGPLRLSVAIPPEAPFAIGGKIDAPTPEEYPDRNFNIFSQVYREAAALAIPVRVKRTAPAGEAMLPVHVEFQACTDRYCLPPRTDTVALPVVIARPAQVVASGEDTVAIGAADIATSSGEPETAAAVTTESVAPGPTPEPSQTFGAPGDLGSLVRFLWVAAGMGLLSLLTPCVLPMIPITVVFFSREGGSRSQRAVAAFAHAGGIAAGFTLLGLAVSTAFGASGVVRLAADPWLNLAIAALFAAFALNLLGAYQIPQPAQLLGRLARVGGSGAGAPPTPQVLPATLMGIAFAIASFTCTAPFVGTLLVLATQGNWKWPLIGLSTYALAFAVPFLILALAPGLLGRLPRPGAWMLTLKACLAVAEVALAIKFVSNADMVMHWGVFTREVVLVLWLCAMLVMALLVLGAIRTPGTNGRPRMTPARTALAAVALATAAWLGWGIRGESVGELEAYLPVRAASAQASSPTEPSLSWLVNDFDGSLARARAEGRLVFADFTGYTCTNCRWMEANMFERPEVAALLDQYVRVRLFTDGKGEVYRRQQQLQQERFATVALPYYAILDASGKPLATFLGMTRESEEFVRFLTAPLGQRVPPSTP